MSNGSVLMLIVALVVLLDIAFLMFLYIPRIEKITELKEQLKEAKLARDSALSQLAFVLIRNNRLTFKTEVLSDNEKIIKKIVAELSNELEQKVKSEEEYIRIIDEKDKRLNQAEKKASKFANLCDKFRKEKQAA